jgi:hypothetical protein
MHLSGELVPVRMKANIGELPVVKTVMSRQTFIGPEPESADEVQGDGCTGAGAGDAADVEGYLRLVQRDGKSVSEALWKTL